MSFDNLSNNNQEETSTQTPIVSSQFDIKTKLIEETNIYYQENFNNIFKKEFQFQTEKDESSSEFYGSDISNDLSNEIINDKKLEDILKEEKI